MLILHGGPGNPYSPFGHLFQGELEKHFVVVKWDQRGSGKSFSDTPASSINLNQYLADTHELVLQLQRRFHRRKIFLMGHSWGSYLGIVTAHRYPELFYAYVGVGQLVDLLAQERISHNFALQEAKKEKNEEAIKELNDIGEPPYRNVATGMEIKYKWLAKYGGFLYGEKGYDLLENGMGGSSEYSLWDMVNYIRGATFSMENMAANQKDDFWKLSLVQKTPGLDQVTELKVPAFFLNGKYDSVTPVDMVADYYRKLKAPKKELIVFDHSAHFPFLKEREKFSRIMIQKVIKESFSR